MDKFKVGDIVHEKSSPVSSDFGRMRIENIYTSCGETWADLLDRDGCSVGFRLCELTHGTASAPTPDPEPEIEGNPDIVKNPAHYARFAIQPLEFALRNKLAGHVWNIVKYTCRAGHKLYPGMDATQSEIKDLEKAIDVAQKQIRFLKGEPIFQEDQ